VSLRRLLTTLVNGGVKFVVVGMVAGNIHGSHYTTEDLDVVYDTSEANIEAMYTALATLHPRVAEGWPLEQTTDFSAAVLASEQSVTLLTDEGEIDLLHRIDGVGVYADVIAVSSPVALEEGSIRVIGLEGLIATKRASGRPKDLLHLPDLELVKELRDRRQD
jgi:predicted nucleotidyltransferase